MHLLRNSGKETGFFLKNPVSHLSNPGLLRRHVSINVPESGKLHRIVCAEYANFVVVVTDEGTQPRPIPQSCLTVNLHAPLEPLQSKRAVRMVHAHLTTKQVCVAAMEKPSIRRSHRHATMPARMPRQWDEQYFGLVVGDHVYTVKPVPLLALERVDDPLRSVRPQGRPVTLAFGECCWTHSGLMLLGE